MARRHSSWIGRHADQQPHRSPPNWGLKYRNVMLISRAVDTCTMAILVVNVAIENRMDGVSLYPSSDNLITVNLLVSVHVRQWRSYYNIRIIVLMGVSSIFLNPAFINRCVCPYSGVSRMIYFQLNMNNSPLSILSSRICLHLIRQHTSEFYLFWHTTLGPSYASSAPFFYKLIQIDNRLLITTSCQRAYWERLMISCKYSSSNAAVHAQRLIGDEARRRCCRCRTTLQPHSTFSNL